MKAGVCLVPEDRKGQGVVLDAPIRDQRHDGAAFRGGEPARLRPAGARAQDSSTISAGSLRLKASRIDAPVSSLSGGNQQKVVLAKWFHAGGDVIILDEPTRGVDVGAKSEIYGIVLKLAEAGKAVLVISSEHQELFGLCDRILVMGEGQVARRTEASGLQRGKASFARDFAKHVHHEGGVTDDDDQRTRSRRADAGSISATLLHRFGTLGIFVVLVVVASLWSPSFLTKPNILNVLRQVASSAGIMAVGMLFVILTRGIDLSVGSVAALGCVLTAYFIAFSGYSVPDDHPARHACPARPAALVTGGFVAYLKLPSFVMSLAMMAIARGLSLIFSAGRPIPIGDGGEALADFGSGYPVRHARSR